MTVLITKAAKHEGHVRVPSAGVQAAAFIFAVFGFPLA
ncbi:hypothetical protein A2U01_0071376, partial [Trifolium medium]|nr:hypothetical protein [Trifolium medium]